MYVLEAYLDRFSPDNKQACRTRAFAKLNPPDKNTKALIHAARGRRAEMKSDSLKRKWERQVKDISSPFETVKDAYSQIEKWGHTGDEFLEKSLTFDEVVDNLNERQKDEDVLIRGKGADVFIRQIVPEWDQKWKEDRKSIDQRYFFVMVWNIGSYILDCEEGVALHSSYFTVSSDWRG